MYASAETLAKFDRNYTLAYLLDELHSGILHLVKNTFIMNFIGLPIPTSLLQVDVDKRGLFHRQNKF